MSLTPRERLTRTLNHQDPGKIVVDFGSTPITGINANAVAGLRDMFKLEKHPVRVNEPLQLLGEVEEDLRKAMDVDVVGVTNNMTIFGFENTGWKPWKLQSGLDVVVPENFNTTVNELGETFLYPQGDMTVPPSGRMPKNGFYFDNIVRGESAFESDDASARQDFKDDFGVYTDEQLRTIQTTCDYYWRNTDYGIIGGGALCGIGDFASVPGPNVKHPKGVRNLEEFMMAHIIMPDYIHELFEMQLEVALKNAALFHQATGDKVQVMQISGTDFGLQRGPFMSLESFRTFYLPYYTRINAWIHANTNWKTFFHSCGSIAAFLDDFVACGVDVINPVQTTAEGMGEEYLKAAYGDKLVFWGGGVNTQNTLPFGTPEQVYDEVKHRLEVFAPGGGFVFNAVHNIQGQTPIPNILAMLQAIRDYDAKRCKTK